MSAYFDAAHVHIQAAYCHSSFGTKIKIERLGELLYIPQSETNDKPLTASESALDSLDKFTGSNIGEADLMVYMCHDTSSGREPCRGIAWSGTVCKNTKKRASSITEYQTSQALFGQVSFENFLQKSPRMPIYKSYVPKYLLHLFIKVS